MSRLTFKQQKFVDYYDGNATETARKAGYKGNNTTLAQVGAENLRKPYILDAIRARNAEEREIRIATRQMLQIFWNFIMCDETLNMRVRLKASELLAKSQGYLIQRNETREKSHEDWLKIIMANEDSSKKIVEPE